MSEPERGGSPSPADLRKAKRELLDRLLAQEGLVGPGEIRRRPAGAPVPLSHAQEVLWLLDRATPDLIAYNSALGFRLKGALDLTVLQGALDALVARHESLRTRIGQLEEQPVQIVDPPGSVDLLVEDLRSIPLAEREAEAKRRLRAHARYHFDLTREHLFRAAVIRLSDDDALLLLLTHHIVSDAWSYGIMVRELSAWYAAVRAGRDAGLPAPSVQFGDYATWERNHLVGERLANLLTHWRGVLVPLPQPLEVPADRPRRGAASFEGGRASLLLPRPLLDRIRALAAGEEATLYMVLLAAFQTVLHRWSGQDDLITGSAIGGRSRAETEGMIGYFSPALPLRTRFFPNDTFRSLLRRIRGTVLGVLEYQDVPIEALAQELSGSEGRQAAPLFQAVLTMQDERAVQLTLEGVQAAPIEIESGTTKFELTLLPSERDDGLELLLWFRSDLFEQADAERLLGHLATLLEAVIDAPEVPIHRLPILTAPERADLQCWSGDLRSPSKSSMIALIELAVDQHPGSVALIGEAGSLSYAELEARANQLAHRLRALGVQTESPVGLALDRSVEAIVAMIGIWKAGGAYVPLDPAWPAARVGAVIGESGVKVVITRSEFFPPLPSNVTCVRLEGDQDALAAESSQRIPSPATPETLAYILYTSGSTGVPKGVGVTHANLVHYVRAITRVLSPGEVPLLSDWTFGLANPLTADLGNTALFPPLCAGGTLHVLSEAVATEPARFAEYLGSHAIDVLKLTPSHLRALVGEKSGPELARSLPDRWLILGGEPLPLPFAARLATAGPCRLLNHYGPTETTVGATCFECTRETLARAEGAGAQTAPIGSPLAGVKLGVLDVHHQLSPVGVPGELFIAGGGVARGYVGRADLTEERFGEAPGLGRAYRTGDRVRWLASGRLEFLGRTDQQIKLRGFRVELEEIELVLGEHPAVAQSAVVLQADDSGEQRLVGFVVPRSGGYAAAHGERATPESLAGWAQARLPAYMVPSQFVILDSFPLTASGKVDRALLRAPESPAAADDQVAPRNDTEASLAQIWAEVLKRDRVGVTDNFLALGGHSLMAIRILGKISRVMGVRLPLRALFDAPTIEQLAQLIEQSRTGGQTAASPAPS
ncbi:MAG: non-ribosomal peptide synthetase [Gemmatimonadales bacterium]